MEETKDLAQPEAIETGPAYEVLIDTVPVRESIVLDGWMERQKFHPVLAAVCLLVVGFLLFQGIGAVVSVGIVVAQNGIDALSIELFTSSPEAVLIGNTVGQFIGLGLLVWLWTRLHVRKPASFLRVRKSDGPLLIWSVLGLLMLFPVVQWLGGFSESLPWPDAIREFDEAQVALIEELLGSGQTGVLFNLFTLAVTPALCEELMFRGYIQRQFERSTGVVWSIVLTGVIFGLYHIRFTQAIPLAVLGIYMAYVTWKTGSLWPAIAVHLANNGFAVIASAYVASSPDFEMEAIEQMNMPWYVVVFGLLFFALIIRILDRRARELQTAQNGAMA